MKKYIIGMLFLLLLMVVTGHRIFSLKKAVFIIA